MIILIRNLHSIILKLALAPALEWNGLVPVLGTKSQWWPLADCQIQESFSWVEPGSLGFTIAVLAFISSTVNTLKWIIWSGDVPSFISQALHCIYSLQWMDICRFIFFTSALKQVLTTLHGATQIIWEFWKLFQQWGPWCSSNDGQHEISNGKFLILHIPFPHYHWKEVGWSGAQFGLAWLMFLSPLFHPELNTDLWAPAHKQYHPILQVVLVSASMCYWSGWIYNTMQFLQ